MKNLMLVLFLAICLPATVFGEDIYSGSFGGVFSGWSIVQWNDTTLSAESTIAGKKTLMVVATAKFGRLYIQTPTGFRLGLEKERQNLFLSLMSPTKVTKNHFFISLHDMEGKVIQALSAGDYIKGESFAEGVWYNLEIPVSDLKGTDRTISAVSVEIEEPGVFFADAISFSKAAGSYMLPPTVKAVKVSCQVLPTNTVVLCKAVIEGLGNINQAVVWGTSLGAIDASGQYIPPLGVRAQVIVTATSVQDPKVFGSITLSLVPMEVKK